MTAYPKPTRRARSIGKQSRANVGLVREGVFNRDGHQCVAAGFSVAFPCAGVLTIQHASGRGMGGSALTDGPEFLRTMCAHHNTLETSDAFFGRVCTRMGWSMSRLRVDVTPDRVPVRYPDGLDYLLLGDFQREQLTAAQAEQLRVDLHGIDFEVFALSLGMELEPWQLDLAESYFETQSPRRFAIDQVPRRSGKATMRHLLDLYSALHGPLT